MPVYFRRNIQLNCDADNGIVLSADGLLSFKDNRAFKLYVLSYFLKNVSKISTILFAFVM